MSDARNVVLSAFGMRGSGKSHLLGDVARHFPRRLVLDFLGEHDGRIPGARYAWDLPETVDALRAAAKAGERWTVVSGMDERDVPALVSALMPSGRLSRAGFSRAVGGMMLECGEVDLIAPNHSGISDEVKSLWKRGRHHWLSLLTATQRAAETHRIITSMSDAVCSFRQHEPRDIAYLASVMASPGVDVAAELAKLPRYWYLRKWVQLGRLELVDPAGRVSAVLSAPAG